MQHQKLSKITKKSISSWCLAVFGFRPLPQTSPSQGHDAHQTLFKKEPFLGAKAKATPHAMRFQYARHQMPCASPDLKQAGACGRRPGQFRRGGGRGTHIAQPCL